MISRPLRIILADDEPPARERLRQLLRGEKDFDLVGEAHDGPSALTMIRKRQPHVVLLDIRLPGMTGFEVLAHLGDERPPAVIFVTAFREHAVGAFEAKAVDYLLKPFSKERFRVALNRARQRCAAEPEALLKELAADRNGTGERIVLRSGIRRVMVSVNDILWVEAGNTVCDVFLLDRSWKVGESLTSLERRLPTDRFVRISRFALVNLRHVVAIEPKSHGDQSLLLRNQHSLTVARTRRREVLARLKHGVF